MNRKNAGFVAIIVFLVSASAFSLNLFFKQRSDHDLINISDLPKEIAGWTGEDLEITDKEYRILETRNILLRKYTSPDGNQITLFIVYSETNRSVFHPPEVCLMGSGITIEDKTRDMFSHRSRDIYLNKLFLNKGNSKDVVLYCYKSGDLYTDSYYLQQAAFALSQLFGKHTPGATIRVSINARDGVEDELAILKTFMTEVISEMERL